MSDEQAEEKNVFKKYSIRSEHSLFITTCTNDSKSRLWIEGKLWQFSYELATSRYNSTKLQLQMKKNSLAVGVNKTTPAEIIIWYWNATKEIVILHRKIYDDFSQLNENTPPSPVNYKFNLVIRLLDKRNENDDNNSLLESYYGDFGKSGIEMVTLHIVGTNGETEASFTIPKYVLMQASAVFNRMFTDEMTEKATGEVKIKDTTVEEFGDFLKAISPKHEYPNTYNVRALLKLADRYECQLLLDRCEAHLMNCIEIPVMERIKCADIYGLKEFKENLLMHFEGTGILESYWDAKPNRDFHLAIDKLIE